MDTPTPNPSPVQTAGTATSNAVKGIIALIVLAALVAVYFLASSDKGFQIGDKVYAEWGSKTWYPGTVDKTCETGFSVKFTDGTEKCVTETQLIKDKAPSASAIDIGDKIIAKWTGTAYYDGEVTAETGDTFKVKYYDGVEYEVGPSELRLDPRAAK